MVGIALHGLPWATFGYWCDIRLDMGYMDWHMDWHMDWYMDWHMDRLRDWSRDWHVNWLVVVLDWRDMRRFMLVNYLRAALTVSSTSLVAALAGGAGAITG